MYIHTNKQYQTIIYCAKKGSGLVTLDYQRPQDWRVSLEIVHDPEKLYFETSLTILH